MTRTRLLKTLFLSFFCLPLLALPIVSIEDCLFQFGHILNPGDQRLENWKRYAEEAHKLSKTAPPFASKNKSKYREAFQLLHQVGRFNSIIFEDLTPHASLGSFMKAAQVRAAVIIQKLEGFARDTEDEAIATTIRMLAYQLRRQFLVLPHDYLFQSKEKQLEEHAIKTTGSLKWIKSPDLGTPTRRWHELMRMAQENDYKVGSLLEDHMTDPDKQRFLDFFLDEFHIFDLAYVTLFVRNCEPTFQSIIDLADEIDLETLPNFSQLLKIRFSFASRTKDGLALHVVLRSPHAIREASNHEMIDFKSRAEKQIGETLKLAARLNAHSSSQFIVVVHAPHGISQSARLDIQNPGDFFWIGADTNFNFPIIPLNLKGKVTGFQFEAPHESDGLPGGASEYLNRHPHNIDFIN